RLATADLVLTKVLQGARSEKNAAAVQTMMTAAEMIVVSDDMVAVQAAQNYRLLRSRGVMTRSTIDTLIATRCILDGMYLLYSDRDFDPFVEHLGLRSALAYPGVN
ncbi:MAG: VapC toxin family PIN domain ribonuclease, partial [Pseudomonadota bacterium]|nr:VapC toxin family PIN domain ribonuclease [Pseudomonadota bacterium]